ncbi:MAG: hypothetical protein LBS09_08195 [Bacteroidales bacterium]|jgi:hypothetical protein|nr:hypothetical protein [Bacteroidales bacterium]
MMRNGKMKFAIPLLFLLFPANASDTVLLYIGRHEFTLGEFTYVYRKNNHYAPQTPEKCLQAFIDYKLKIVAALETLPDSLCKYNAHCSEHENARYLCGERRDGCLLAEIDRKTIAGIVADTVGQFNFYRQHPKSFRLQKRMEATVYHCNDRKTAIAALKIIRNKNEKNGRLPNNLLSFFCGGGRVCMDTVRLIVPKGVDALADKVKWHKGISNILEWNGKFVFLDVHAILPPARKTFEEARGEVIAAYSEETERRRMETLSRQYPVTVVENVWQRFLSAAKRSDFLASVHL